jgi:hypothetical protein
MYNTPHAQDFFHGKLRDEYLNKYLFRELKKRMIEAWRWELQFQKSAH